jgi:hypothetical protein
MKTVTINTQTVEATVEAIEAAAEITKPMLINWLEKEGVKVPAGKISKTDLIDMVVDHAENTEAGPATADFKQAIADLQADQEAAAASRKAEAAEREAIEAEMAIPEEVAKAAIELSTQLHGITPAPAAEVTPEPFVVGPKNAPAGMVYCKNCKSHVPKSGTLPTSEMDVYVCLKACKAPAAGATGLSMVQKAANAAAGAVKAKSAPKAASTGTRTLFAPTDVITAIGPRGAKGFSAVAFGALYEGQTVAQAIADIAALETGAITGRSELAFDVKHDWIKIVTAAEYATMTADSETDPEADTEAKAE